MRAGAREGRSDRARLTDGYDAGLRGVFERCGVGKKDAAGAGEHRRMRDHPQLPANVGTRLQRADEREQPFHVGTRSPHRVRIIEHDRCRLAERAKRHASEHSVRSGACGHPNLIAQELSARVEVRWFGPVHCLEKMAAADAQREPHPRIRRQCAGVLRSPSTAGRRVCISEREICVDRQERCADDHPTQRVVGTLSCARLLLRHDRRKSRSQRGSTVVEAASSAQTTPGAPSSKSWLVHQVARRLDAAIPKPAIREVQRQQLFGQDRRGVGEHRGPCIVRKPQRHLQEAGNAVAKRRRVDATLGDRPRIHRSHRLDRELAERTIAQRPRREPDRARYAWGPVTPSRSTGVQSVRIDAPARLVWNRGRPIDAERISAAMPDEPRRGARHRFLQAIDAMAGLHRESHHGERTRDAMRQPAIERALRVVLRHAFPGQKIARRIPMRNTVMFLGERDEGVENDLQRDVSRGVCPSRQEVGRDTALNPVIASNSDTDTPCLPVSAAACGSTSAHSLRSRESSSAPYRFPSRESARAANASPARPANNPSDALPAPRAAKSR